MRAVWDQVGGDKVRLWEGERRSGRGGAATAAAASSPLSHLELCWSVRTAFLLVRLRKMAASVPMKSMYMPEKSSWSGGGGAAQSISLADASDRPQALLHFYLSFPAWLVVSVATLKAAAKEKA